MESVCVKHSRIPKKICADFMGKLKHLLLAFQGGRRLRGRKHPSCMPARICTGYGEEEKLEDGASTSTKDHHGE